MKYSDGLKLIETTLYGGGALGDVPMGDQGGNVGNVDFYAPGDARTPFILGQEDEDKKKKKKKKKKKSKKTPIYRRAFVEESTEESYIIDGMIICENVHALKLAKKILEQTDLIMYSEKDMILLNGDENEVCEFIDTLHETIGEKNFADQYYCLLGEFNYSDSLKQPKKPAKE